MQKPRQQGSVGDDEIQIILDNLICRVAISSHLFYLWAARHISLYNLASWVFLFAPDGSSNDGLQINRLRQANSRLEKGAKVLLMSQGKGVVERASRCQWKWQPVS
ncbi:hypothetical protein V8C35DRAFT_76848 [Trichoderma chlorosporum]